MMIDVVMHGQDRVTRRTTKLLLSVILYFNHDQKGESYVFFIVVVWIFLFNKYMIQNPVFFVYNVLLSIVYAIVLWANFYVKLLMSSAKAAVNSFDECNVFEKAAQKSVIVYDN